MSLQKQTFTHEDITLSFYAIENVETGDIWMTGSSIAESLGYQDPKRGIYDNVSIINKLPWNTLIKRVGSTYPSITLPLNLPKNWQPTTMMINEAGLNQLIMRSKLPNAQKFQQWVCADVLPAIRKHGQYVPNEIVYASTSALESENEKLKLMLRLNELERENDKNKYEIQLRDAKIEVGEYKLAKEMAEGKAEKVEMLQRCTQVFAKEFADDNAKQLETIANFEGRIVNSTKNPNYKHAITMYSYKKRDFRTKNETVCVKISRAQIAEISKIDSQIKSYQYNQRGGYSYDWMNTAHKECQVLSPNSIKLWQKVRENHPHMWFGFNIFNSTATNFTVLNYDELIKKYSDLSNELYKFEEFVDDDIESPTPIHLQNFKDLQLRNVNEAIDKCYTSLDVFIPKLVKIIKETALEANEEIEVSMSNAKRRNCDIVSKIRLLNELHTKSDHIIYNFKQLDNK